MVSKSIPTKGLGVILAFALLGLPASSTAASPEPRFERVSIDQGLSQNSVYAMLQDHLGFLWIGTDDGLNRYDGYEFETLRSSPDGLNSLSHSRIRSLLEDRDGILWIGTRNGGLNRYDRRTKTFTHYRHDPSSPESLAADRVRALLQDRHGTIWLGTGGGGVDRFEPGQEGVFSHLQHDPDDPESLSQNFVRALYEDRAGNIWIGTIRGLNRLDAERRSLTRYIPLPDQRALGYNSIGAIHEDEAGILWLGTWSGLMRFDPEAPQTFTFFGASSDQPDDLRNSIRGIHQSQDGTLLLASDGSGILHFDPATETLSPWAVFDPLRSSSLSGDHAKHFLEDRSGAFWVGTSGKGLNKLIPPAKAFTHQLTDPEPQRLSDNMVTAIHEDRSGQLWVGTREGGLHRIDRQSAPPTEVPTRRAPESTGAEHLVAGDVRSVLEDSAGRLWVGTEGGGLFRLGADGTSVHYLRNPEDPTSLWDNDIWVLFEDRAGTLWIGSWGGGLSRYDPEVDGFVTYRHDSENPDSLRSNVVRSIHQDSKDRLWIGTDLGLDQMDPASESFRHYSVGAEVLSILEDRKGGLWIGTHGAGLEKLVTDSDNQDEVGTFVGYTDQDGLPNNVVYGILEDDQELLWLSTNRGLSRFDPGTGVFRNYDLADGLQSLEFNSGAYFKSRRGEMFFGGINGFNSFFPDEIQDSSYLPPVVLTSFKKFNQEVPLDSDTAWLSSVRLRHDERVASFGFAALSYTAQHKNQYAYRLVGFRDQWTQLGTSRDVTFTNLDPATYLLEVRASNNDGIWNEQGLALEIIVEPPFWRTWWFILVASLAVAGILLTSYRMRVRGIHRHNRALEAEVVERRRAEQESAAKNVELEMRNAEMERFVYTVSHDLKTPLVTIKGFLGVLEKDAMAGDEKRTRDDVVWIGDAADKMHRLLDDLLELSRVGRLMNPPEPVDLTELAEEVASLVTEKLVGRKVSISIDPAMPLVAGDRLRLAEIYQNLIDNAVKFLGDQEKPLVEVGASQDDGKVLCWVRDNGIGIEARHLDKVFGLFERLDQLIPGTGVGLAIVKRIVEVHGGRIWVESEGLGHGSTIYFTLPPADEAGMNGSPE